MRGVSTAATLESAATHPNASTFQTDFNPLRHISSTPPAESTSSPTTTAKLSAAAATTDSSSAAAASTWTLPTHRVQMVYTKEILESSGMVEKEIANASLITELSLRYDSLPLPPRRPSTSTSDGDAPPTDSTQGQLVLANLQIRYGLFDENELSTVMGVGSVNGSVPFAFGASSSFIETNMSILLPKTSFTSLPMQAKVSREHFRDPSILAMNGDPLLIGDGETDGINVLLQPDDSSALGAPSAKLYDHSAGRSGWLHVHLPPAPHFTWNTSSASSKRYFVLDVECEGMTTIYPTSDSTDAGMTTPSISHDEPLIPIPQASFTLLDGERQGTMLARVDSPIETLQSSFPFLFALRLGRGHFPSRPFVSSVTPAAGSAMGGTLVTVSGSYFPLSDDDIWSASLVLVNQRPCTDVRVVDNATFTCRTPLRTQHDPDFPSQVAFNFKVMTLSGGLLPSISAATATYTYISPPILYDVSPSFGGPGTRLRLLGAYLGLNRLDVASVKLGPNISCTAIQWVSPNLVTCVVGRIPKEEEETVTAARLLQATEEKEPSPAIGASTSTSTSTPVGSFILLDMMGEQRLPIIVTTYSGGSSEQNDDGKRPSTAKYFRYQIPPVVRMRPSSGNETVCVRNVPTNAPAAIQCPTLADAVTMFARAGATFLLEPGVYVEPSPITILNPQMSFQALPASPLTGEASVIIQCGSDGCLSFAEEKTDASSAWNVPGGMDGAAMPTRYVFPRLVSGIIFEPIPPAPTTPTPVTLSEAMFMSTKEAKPRRTLKSREVRLPQGVELESAGQDTVISTLSAGFVSSLSSSSQPSTSGHTSVMGSLFHLELNNAIDDEVVGRVGCESASYGEEASRAVEAVSRMVEYNQRAIGGVNFDSDSTIAEVTATSSSFSSIPLVFDRCIFRSVRSSTGPSIVVLHSNVVFRECLFADNANDDHEVGHGAAAIHVAGGSDIMIHQCTFERNHAHYGAAVTLLDATRASIAGSRFVSNDARQSGGALYARGGPMLLLNDTTFESNTASMVGGAMYVERATLVGNHVTCQENSVGSAANSIGATVVGMSGGCIRAVVSTVDLMNSTVLNNNAGWPNLCDGGAVHATYSSLSFNSVLFESNLASRGGALALDTLSSLTARSITFTRNLAGYSKDQIEAAATRLGIQINSTLNLATMLSNDPQRWGQGGAIYSTNYLSSSISGAEFSYNTANDGGAIYLDRSSATDNADVNSERTTIVIPLPLRKQNHAVFIIENATFIGNGAAGRDLPSIIDAAQQGQVGMDETDAIEQDVQTASPLPATSDAGEERLPTLDDNSTSSGSAQLPDLPPLMVNGGGAIVAITSPFSCVNCSFDSNGAPLGGGGAILWQDDVEMKSNQWRLANVEDGSASSVNASLPLFPASTIHIPRVSSSYSGNQALYGQDIATVPSTIRVNIMEVDDPFRIFPLDTPDEELEADEVATRQRLLNKLHVQQSGKVLDPSLSIELLDSYGSRVTTRDSSFFRVRLMMQQSLADIKPIHPGSSKPVSIPTSIGTPSRLFHDGLANFTDVGLVAFPGGNLSLSFECMLPSGHTITTKQPSSAASVHGGATQADAATGLLLLRISMRPCQPGEWLDWPSNRCRVCPAGMTTHEENALECHVEEVEVASTPRYVLAVVISVFILLELGALCGVIHFRSHRVIFSASPLFCAAILCGAILALVGGLLIVVQPLYTASSICIVSIWALNIGFMLCFGSMVSKTYRLYRIFDNAQFTPVAISNAQLMTRLFALILFDTAVIATWQGVAPSHLEVEQYRVCTSELSHVFTPILLSTKALLIAYGAYLTWRVRHIPSNYNESTYLAISIWNVFFLAFVTLSLEWGLGSNLEPPILTLIQSVAIALGSALSMATIFTPHFINIYKERRLKRKHDAIRRMKQELKGTQGGKGSKGRGSGSSNSVSLNRPPGVSDLRAFAGTDGDADRGSNLSDTGDAELFQPVPTHVDAADYQLPPLPIPAVISHLIRHLSSQTRRHPLEDQFVALSSDLTSATRSETASLKRLAEVRKQLVECLAALANIHFEIEFQKEVHPDKYERAKKRVEDRTKHGSIVSSARSRPMSTAPPSRRMSLAGASTATTAPPTAHTTPRVSLQRSGSAIVRNGSAELSTMGGTGSVMDPGSRRHSAPSSGASTAASTPIDGTPAGSPAGSRRPSTQHDALSTIYDMENEVKSPTSVRVDLEEKMQESKLKGRSSDESTTTTPPQQNRSSSRSDELENRTGAPSVALSDTSTPSSAVRRTLADEKPPLPPKRRPARQTVDGVNPLSPSISRLRDVLSPEGGPVPANTTLLSRMASPTQPSRRITPQQQWLRSTVLSPPVRHAPLLASSRVPVPAEGTTAALAPVSIGHLPIASPTNLHATPTMSPPMSYLNPFPSPSAFPVSPAVPSIPAASNHPSRRGVSPHLRIHPLSSAVSRRPSSPPPSSTSNGQTAATYLPAPSPESTPQTSTSASPIQEFTPSTLIRRIPRSMNAGEDDRGEKQHATSTHQRVNGGSMNNGSALLMEHTRLPPWHALRFQAFSASTTNPIDGDYNGHMSVDVESPMQLPSHSMHPYASSYPHNIVRSLQTPNANAPRNGIHDDHTN